MTFEMVKRGKKREKERGQKVFLLYIYSQFSSKLLSPPTEELLEAAKKIYKNCENLMKKFIIKSINSVIKSRTGNLTPLVPEYIKFLLKTGSVSNK